MLEYTITARRNSPAVAIAECTRAEQASLSLDVDPVGRTDAFNPAELLPTGAWRGGRGLVLEQLAKAQSGSRSSTTETPDS